MMKQSTFYGLDADQVSKNEALRYFDIENMVHYLYEAGKEPLNNYVYCAMLLVKIVFSQEEGKWGRLFENGSGVCNLAPRRLCGSASIRGQI